MNSRRGFLWQMNPYELRVRCTYLYAAHYALFASYWFIFSSCCYYFFSPLIFILRLLYRFFFFPLLLQNLSESVVRPIFATAISLYCSIYPYINPLMRLIKPSSLRTVALRRGAGEEIEKAPHQIEIDETTTRYK